MSVVSSSNANMMSAPSSCWIRMLTSGVNLWVSPLRYEVNVTPSSSTFARRVELSAMTSSSGTAVSMARTFLKPTPRLITWKPPESVNVGPGQFMKRPSPPAASTMSEPGCRKRWYALARTACAPRSATASGRTAFTVALVPTTTKAGVRMVPCGVVMTPVRPSPPSSREPTSNEKLTAASPAALVDVGKESQLGHGDGTGGHRPQHGVTDEDHLSARRLERCELVGRDATFGTDDEDDLGTRRPDGRHRYRGALVEHVRRRSRGQPLSHLGRRGRRRDHRDREPPG